MHVLRKKLTNKKSLFNRYRVRIRMEDSYTSVHLDYRNQRHIYISITDFSLKNTLPNKKQNPKTQKTK